MLMYLQHVHILYVWTLLGAPGLEQRRYLGLLALLLGARTLVGAFGIAIRSKDATRHTILGGKQKVAGAVQHQKWS